MDFKRILRDIVLFGIPVFALLGIFNLYLNEEKQKRYLLLQNYETQQRTALLSNRVFYMYLRELECVQSHIPAKDKKLLFEGIKTYKGILLDKLDLDTVSSEDKGLIKESLHYVPTECEN